jgi:cytochrome c biogenesis protein CcdA/thiol-disulfide isomerase/thioredoxin
MAVLLFFAFISGLVTIFAPCIWPLLPIILSSTTSGGHRKPLGITLGILISFALLTLTISYIVKIIPFDPEILRYFAVVIIGFLGIMLVIPKLSQLLEGYVSRLSGKFGRVKSTGDGFNSGLITGISLGIVWTPCAGPILATIATLAATRAVNFQIVLVTLVYVAGVGIPLFIFAQVGQKLLTSSRSLSKYTGIIQQVFGFIMILTAVSIFTGYDKVLQAKLLDAVPSYSTFLNKLETNDAVKNQLDTLRGSDKKEKKVEMRFPSASRLPSYGRAPEFTGINNWLNSQSPVTMASLKGKVVLVDFWTYTCINCIRTLPYVTSWYEKYKDQNFVVIGVHTPEFEFEKKTENVQMATVQYKINYPVAQDNDFATWRAYDNHYWPAKYLIDAEGNIRYFHFGEGNYQETEENIRTLIEEAGQTVNESRVTTSPQVQNYAQTPETYLGNARIANFKSEESISAGVETYSFPKILNTNQVAFDGTWNVEEEFSESKNNSKLRIQFHANKVFLVIHPKTGAERVTVMLDGKQISVKNTGKDVVDGVITVTEPRLYELVDFKEKPGNHLLELQFLNEGIEVFAFTFG